MLTIGLMMLFGILRSKNNAVNGNPLQGGKISFDSINDNPIGI